MLSIPSIISSGGRWDEQGLVGSLDRKGFTPSKCISELIANSCDAQSIKVLFKINRKYISMIDIGKGMNFEALDNMFAMFKSNNQLRKSMGVSGLGGKEALYILSKKNNSEPTISCVFTKTKDGDYLKAIIPWNDIFNLKIYTNKIQFSLMNEEEILNFNKERENELFQHGTTLRWEYSEILMESLDQQFDKNKRENLLEPKERWDLVFGLSNINIVLEKSDGTHEVVLPKYDYFGGIEIDYYCGKNIEIIEHFVDDQNKDRFIWINGEDEKPMEIRQTAKITRTVPDNVVVHQSWKHIGTYEIYNGIRKNTKIFDELNPQKLDTASFFLSNYDSETFEHSSQIEKIRDYLSKVRLYRNNQCVTVFKLDGYNCSTARGNGASMLKTFHHRTEVRYSTFSSQDNKMDISMGIQENKNQNQNEFPKIFERLISFLKEKNLKKIDEYFNIVIKNFREKQKVLIKQLVQVPLKIEEDFELTESNTEINSESTDDNIDIYSVSSCLTCRDEDVPIINEVIPAINEVIPAVNEVIPDVNEVIPIINKDVPIINKVIPVVNEEIFELINKKIIIDFIINNFDETDITKISKLYDFLKSL